MDIKQVGQSMKENMQPHKEHSCDLQLEKYPLSHKMYHTMTAQSLMTHDKSPCEKMQHYWEVEAWHLIVHYVALVSQDASAKVEA